MIGDILSAATSFVSNTVNAVVNAVPGASAVVGAIDAVASGPIRDFARSAVGQVVVAALATSLDTALVPFVGPQIASVAFAVPGVAAGNDFLTAWTSGVCQRVAQTANILGPAGASALIAGGMGKVLGYLAANNIANPLVYAMHDLAVRSGACDIAAAAVLDKARGQLYDLVNHTFDPSTGMAINEVAVTTLNLLKGGAVTGIINSVGVQNTPEIQAAAAAARQAMQSHAQLTQAQNFLNPLGASSLVLPKAAPVAAPAAVSAVRAVAPPSSAPATSKTAYYVVGGVLVLGLAALMLMPPKKKRR